MKIISTILLSICLYAVSAQAVSTVDCEFDIEDYGYSTIKVYRVTNANFIVFGNDKHPENINYVFGHYLTNTEATYLPDDDGRESVLNLTQVEFISDLNGRYYKLNFLDSHITIIEKGGSGWVVADQFPMTCYGTQGGE